MQSVCPHCGTINRVQPARLAETPNCGSCHRPLFPGEPTALGSSNFDNFIGHNELPVLVDFWAVWCGPCKMMAPIFEQTAKQLSGRVQFAKVDTDAESALSARYNIRSIPTMVLFKGGREVGRISGAMPGNKLVQWLESSAATKA